MSILNSEQREHLSSVKNIFMHTGNINMKDSYKSRITHLYERQITF